MRTSVWLCDDMILCVCHYVPLCNCVMMWYCVYPLCNCVMIWYCVYVITYLFVIVWWDMILCVCHYVAFLCESLLCCCCVPVLAEAVLQPVFNELTFNLESFNPAFTSCLLMVRARRQTHVLCCQPFVRCSQASVLASTWSPATLPVKPRACSWYVRGVRRSCFSDC